MEVVGERPPPLPPKSRVNQLKMNFQLKPSVKQSLQDVPQREDAGGFYLRQASARGRLANANNPPDSKVAGFYPVTGTRGAPEAEATSVVRVNGATFGARARSGPLRFGGGGVCPGEGAGPKIVSWARKSADAVDVPQGAVSVCGSGEPENGAREEESLYENVSSAGANRAECKPNGMTGRNAVESRERMKNCRNRGCSVEASDSGPAAGYRSGRSEGRNAGKAQGGSDNRQIEVRQVKNKTVVKISIKDNFAEGKANGVENQLKPGVRYYGECAEPEADTDRSPRTQRNPKCDANCRRSCDEMNYANLKQRGCGGDPGENGDDQLYANLNASDPECDQTYENCEFEMLKGGRVTEGAFERFSNSAPVPNGRAAADGANGEDSGEEQIYENQMFGGDEGAYENININITQSRLGIAGEVLVQDKLQANPKPCVLVNVNKAEGEGGRREAQKANQPLPGANERDDQPQKVKSSKVVVTISSLQSDKSDSEEAHPKRGPLDEGENEKQPGHKRAESLTSSGVGVDTEESDCEGSNISCDSLNSNDLNALSTSEDHGYHTPNSENKTGSPVCGVECQNGGGEGSARGEPAADAYENVEAARKGFETRSWDGSCNGFRSTRKKQPGLPPQKASAAILHKTEVDDSEEPKSLPKGLLRDIRSRSVKLSSAYPKGEKGSDAPEESEIRRKIITFSSLSGEGERKSEKARKEERKLPEAEDKPLKVEERTYEERKSRGGGASERVNKICAMEVDTDKFYKFHLYENRSDANGEKNGHEEETFAGVKDYLNREKQAAIKSAKGTIRGVKNRVKAGIATFLQMQENKTYKDRDAGKIVVYSTTMGIVRDTYHKCLKVKQILRTLMVKFEERDVFMSSDAQEEIRERMKCDAILVPQVFVEGQHIGDAETIERLNESGELRKILKPYKSPDACSTCHVCGGYRLLPCSICKGSKKSVHRNHFTAEFVALKCMNCDQVGLTKCYAC